MTPSLERWPTKAKEVPSPHEVRLAPLDTNPVFQSLGEEFKKYLGQKNHIIYVQLRLGDSSEGCDDFEWISI